MQPLVLVVSILLLKYFFESECQGKARRKTSVYELFISSLLLDNKLSHSLVTYNNKYYLTDFVGRESSTVHPGASSSWFVTG